MLPPNEESGTEPAQLVLADSARRILQHVVERASDRGMMHSGELTEATAGMLAVLSIVKWERKVARAALEDLGIDLCRFGQAIDDAIVTEGKEFRDPGVPQFRILPSGEQQRILDPRPALLPLRACAEVEARHLAHNWVAAEHLLLGAVSTACPRFQHVLQENAVTHRAIKQAVMTLLRPETK